MQKAISVKEASVKTAAVEIKSLVVSGRQVTLSLFRQLQAEPIVDRKTGELRGVPWGFVNYGWKGCDPDYENDGRHRHVVWQLGSELRRACLYSGSFKADNAEHASAIRRAVRVGIFLLCYDMVEARTPRPEWKDAERGHDGEGFGPLFTVAVDARTGDGADRVSVSRKAIRFELDHKEFATTLIEWIAEKDMTRDPYWRSSRKRELDGIRQWLASIGPRERIEATLVDNLARVRDAQAAVAAVDTKLTELKKAIDGLDQLFIAT